MENIGVEIVICSCRPDPEMKTMEYMTIFHFKAQ